MYPRMDSFNFKAIPFIILISLLPITKSCQVHLCSSEYSSLVSGHRELQKLQMRDIKPRISERLEYCNLLHAYNHCLKSLTRACRGKLDYHAVLALVRKWIDENQCPKDDYPGLNQRSRQAIRSGSFTSNLSPSNSHRNHDMPGSHRGDENSREEDGDANSDDETSHSINNHESTETNRRGKSSSHHPQCILYAPSLSSSGHHQNYYSPIPVSFLSIILIIISNILSR